MRYKDITDDIRPTCSCGRKMKLVHFENYYTEFLFWECSVDCEIELDTYDTDEYRYEGC